ncbi:MAG: 23S rRNA (uracil(1939)-C(5))-methyltransferase RlmD, partial [Saprospiraceae bacterium]|nr:23S rRNA (uracil(1939)-C(5))-methyltransferase RlmD [Saprospiraceae bacterium]
MARKQLILENVSIHGVADRGTGVGKTPEGLTVFVEGAVPGDVVDVFVQKKKSAFAEGKVERLVTPSPDRREPFCQHFDHCGGCKWQNLDYAAQIHHKEQVVHDAFGRIAKVPVREWLPILGAPQTEFYRNKLEFGYSNKRWLLASEIQETQVNPDEKATFQPGLGFHIAGYFDKILDIHQCWLQADPSNDLRNACRRIALEQGLEFYNLRAHTGILRNLMFRLTTTGEIMVLVSFAKPDEKKIERYLSAILAEFPDLTTIVYCVNQKLNDTVFDQEMITWHGPGYVVEKLGDLKFIIGPKSFFQTNTRQGQNLYDVAAEFAGLSGRENVYDLYTGTGSIALYLARHCRAVVGIEEVPEAIEDAHKNMEANGIQNAMFYAGDVKNVLSPEFTTRHGRPDVIITDPP